MSDKTFHRWQYLLAAVVIAGTAVIYALTMAPTLSYWDCGEFIACSYILGIPHPPGTPLYVLIAHVFTMLPFFADMAVRVNFVSAVSSALAAGMGFFVMVRLIRGVLTTGNERLQPWQAALALCGGLSGTLFMAFSLTHWNNAVEAEVYGPSMFLMLALVWMALRWSDCRDRPRASSYLVAIGYVALLSVGIHMTVFLAMPVIFLYIALVEPSLGRDWKFWLTGVLLFLVAVDFIYFLLLAGTWTLISVIVAISRRSAPGGVGRWGLIAAIMVASWLGYSSQLFIPIRSAQNPNIDENNPETFTSFVSFVERKQYGQEGMVQRMFTRRGKWINQFGDHAHMGFYRYFKQQYGFGGWLMLPVMFFGFWGAWWLIRRSPTKGGMIFLLFLAGSVGLVLYMNFADGTQYYKLRPDAYMEVRNRDYFFTPGFIMFGLMIGLGLTALADTIARRFPKGKTVAVAMAVVAALLPLHTLQANWRGSDRSKNYTPYDYAYNILQSCEPNAILFTGGDNDTFPLWCIQEVYGVRRDVAVVNLSLANIDWYIYQMKHDWGLPITLTDDQILWTVPDRSTGGALRRPKEPYRDPVSGTTHYLFTTRDGERVITPALMITEHILYNNRWRRPVYFSGSPQGKTRLGLEKHTRIVGAVFQVINEESSFGFEYEKTAALIDSVFLLRSYNSPRIGLDENAIGLAMVYPEKMLAIADYYRRAGDSAAADRWNQKAIATFPFYWRSHAQWAHVLRARGDSSGAEEVLADAIDTIGAYVREMPDNRMYWFFWGKVCEAAGHDDEAQQYLTKAFYLNPYDRTTYQSLISFLVSRQLMAEATRAARKWLEYYPDDSRARSLTSLPSP